MNEELQNNLKDMQNDLEVLHNLKNGLDRGGWIEQAQTAKNSIAKIAEILSEQHTLIKKILSNQAA